MVKRKSEELLIELEALKKENSELKSFLQTHNNSVKSNGESFTKESEFLNQLNSFSLKLANLPSNQILPFITSEIKSIFGVKAAIVNTYDETTSELVVQYSSLSDEENAKVINLIGGKLLNRRTFVSEKDYNRILSENYEIIASINKLTFGGIPDSIGKLIEKLFGVDWFAALGLVLNEKLVGTFILAGDKNQPFPEREIVSAFAGIVTSALVRKEAEDKLFETEKRFQSIVNSSPMGMHMYELREEDKLVFIGANPAADKILGFEHKTIIGLTIEEAFPSLIKTEVPLRYREVIKNNSVWKTEQLNYNDNKISGAFEVFAYRVSDNQMVARFLEITGRIQKENAVKESEEKLSIILNSIGDGVISTDRMGCITKMNPVAERLCGWEFEQAEGKPLDEVFKIVNAPTREKLDDPVEKVIKTGKVVELSNHTLLISRDGTEKIISDSAAPIFDKEKKIQGIVLVFSDVTEAYNVRKELEKSEERNRALLNSIPDVMFVLSKNGFFLDYNCSNPDELFLPPESFLNKHVSEVLPADLASLTLENLEKSFHTKEVQNYEYELEIRGEIKHYEARIVVGSENKAFIIIRNITSRKRAEEALLVSRARLEFALKGGELGMWDWNLETGVVAFSDIWAQILEYSPDEVEQHVDFFKNHIHPDDLAATLKRLMGHIDGNLPIYESENRLRTKSGKYKWVLDRGKVVERDANGRPLRAAGVISDITERKQAEKALRESEQRLRRVIDLVPHFIFAKDIDGKFIFANKANADAYGTTPENMLNKTDYDFSSNISEIKHYLEDDKKVIESGIELIAIEETFTDSTGAQRYLQTSKVPFPDSGTEKPSLLGIAMDITERKRAEKALLESEKRLRQVIDLVPISIFSKDVDGKFVLANKAMADSYGTTTENLVGKNDYDFNPNPDEVKQFIEDDKKVIESGIELIAYEEIFTDSKGRKRYLQTTKIPFTTSGTKKPAMLGVAIDITERKQWEEELRNSEEILSLFLKHSPIYTFIKEVTPTSSRVIVASENFIDMIGVPGSKMTGKTMEELFPPEFAAKITNDDWDVAAANKVIKLEEDLNGRHFTTIKFPINLKERQLIAGYTIDNTERKRAEEALKESEELYRKLLTTVPELIIRTDLNSNITFINEFVFPSLNYIPIETFLGKNLLSFIAEEDLPRAIENTKLMFEHHIGHKEYKLKFEDGAILNVEINGDVIYNTENNPTGMVFVIRDITERMQNEITIKINQQKLDETNQLLRTVLDTVPARIFWKDTNLNYLGGNTSFARDAGLLDPRELIGKSDFEMSFNEQAEIYRADDKNVIDSGIARLNYEEPQTTPDGSRIWLRTSKVPIRNQDGKILGVLGTYEDITDRKHSEKALQESEHRLRQVIDLAPLFIFAKDLDGKFILANKAIASAYGTTAESLIGKSDFDFNSNTDEVKKFIEDDKKVIESGIDMVAFEETFTDSKGVTRYHQTTKIPFTTSGTKIPAMLGVAIDITQRKRAEKTQEILYNTAVHINIEKSIEDLLEFVRLELGKILDTTNFFVAIYNPDKDTLEQLIFRDEKDYYDEWPASQTFSGQVVYYGKTIFLRGDEIDIFGRKHNLQVLGMNSACWLGIPIFANNKANGVMVVQHYTNPDAYTASDVVALELIATEIGVFIEKHKMINDLIAAKEKAEEMNRVKSIFFANMSHELRTPFVGIMGYAELLVDSLENPDEKRMAEGILKSSKRMKDTLSVILGLARLESDSFEMKKNKINVKELITNLYESFRGGALLKELLFEKKINFDELIIESDEVIIKDILQNLISNAVKFTDQGSIEIIADIYKKNNSNFLSVKVADTGIGIPKEKLGIIWEPFRQASEGINRSFEGTGLGLSIAKKSSEILGGNIFVESELDKGTVFTLEIPILILS